VQWIGDYSYSIYLWHWPLIIAAPWVLHGATSWPSKLVILAVTLALAVLTKKFVEDPLRSRPAVQRRRRTAYIFAATGTVALVLVSGLDFVGVQQSNDRAAASALSSLQNDVCFGAGAMVASNGCSEPFARVTGLDTAFAASDLEPWEFDVLAALRRAGAPYQLSPKALLQQTLVSSGTMTNRIDRLVGRRLVERRTDPHDGRGVLVVMPTKGREQVDAAIAELVAAEAELLAGLSRADQDRLSALLRKLSLDFDD
jgi:DNA-binding MarR family transcriptional regulator